MTPRRCLLLVSVLFALVAVAASGANPRRLTWSTPVSLSGNPLTALSCPSDQLCVAGGANGLYVSTGPFEDASSWQSIPDPAVYGVACPSVNLCVAVTGDSVLSSRSPTEGVSAWATVPLAVSKGHLAGIACASETLCVAYVEPTSAGGTGGRAPRGGVVFSSANPAGPASAWKRAAIRDVPSAVACAARSVCVLGTLDGDIMTSSHPLRGARGWRRTHQAGAPGAEWPFFSLACASARYCLVGEEPSGGPILRGGFREKRGATKGYLPSSWIPADVRGVKPGTWLPSVVTTSRNQPSMNAGGCSPQGVCAFVGETSDSTGRNTVDRMYVVTRPAGLFRRGLRTWTSTTVANAQLTGVSCPSAHLCVAVGVTPRQPGPGGPGAQADGRITIGRG